MCEKLKKVASYAGGYLRELTADTMILFVIFVPVIVLYLLLLEGNVRKDVVLLPTAIVVFVVFCKTPSRRDLPSNVWAARLGGALAVMLLLPEIGPAMRLGTRESTMLHRYIGAILFLLISIGFYVYHRREGERQDAQKKTKPLTKKAGFWP